MKVKDKVILVTGAGGGMGRELVLNLLKKGARVVALDLNPTALEGTVEKAGELKDHSGNPEEKEAQEREDVFCVYVGLGVNGQSNQERITVIISVIRKSRQYDQGSDQGKIAQDEGRIH